MIIYFATSNGGKLRNAQAAMAPFGFDVKQVKIDFTESRSEDPAEIAADKARVAYRLLKKPVMVEDSGFFIRALGGFPMTHVKFSLSTLGINNILKVMRGVKDRRAEWRMTVAYADRRGVHSCTFVEKGTIAVRPRPVKRPMMSDYWRIYIPTVLKGNTLALSEMKDEGLQAWTEYYRKHNQFSMLGRWLSRQ